jgi:branched-chain amino acid transport system ATP-binding protein
MTSYSTAIRPDEPLLTVSDLHVCYGKVDALRGINFVVNRGEIVTLIGANGAGKSTTLRAVSGMLSPKAGQVTFNGTAITGLPAHDIAARGMGHVPEGRRIFPRLNVEENLDIGAYLEKDASVIQARKQQVYEIFPRLAERRKQDGGTLSGGEQQMLAIGRALMQDPSLLLLDEPTLGLAPILVEIIFKTILKLHEKGKTILLVEQNAWHALQIAHRGYVMQTGQICLSGPSKDLASDPSVQESYLGVG